MNRPRSRTAAEIAVTETLIVGFAELVAERLHYSAEYVLRVLFELRDLNDGDLKAALDVASQFTE